MDGVFEIRVTYTDNMDCIYGASFCASVFYASLFCASLFGAFVFHPLLFCAFLFRPSLICAKCEYASRKINRGNNS